MWIKVNNSELYHHGILGMKWGVQNGPPYPLDSGDHSASEKKAGWRKSLDKSENGDEDNVSGRKLIRLFKTDRKEAQRIILEKAHKDPDYQKLLEDTKQDRQIYDDYSKHREQYVRDAVDYQLKHNSNFKNRNKEEIVNWYLNDDGDQGDYNSFQFFAVKNRSKYGVIDAMWDDADYNRDRVDKTIDKVSSKICGKNSDTKIKIQGMPIYTPKLKSAVTLYLKGFDSDVDLLSSYAIAYNLDASSSDVYSDIKSYYSGRNNKR